MYIREQNLIRKCNVADQLIDYYRHEVNVKVDSHNWHLQIKL